LKYHLDRVPELPEYRAFVDHFPLVFIHCIDWEPLFAPNRRLLPGGLIKRFDWYVLPPDARFPGHRRGRDPATVFAAPGALDDLLAAAARDMDPRHSNRVVVFGGEEEALSSAFGREALQRRAKVRLLRRWFGTIFYYVKDVDADGVKTMPHGLVHMYLSHKRHTAEASRVISAARTDAVAKPKVALAAWKMPLSLQFDRARNFTKRYGPDEQDEAERKWPEFFKLVGLMVPDRTMCKLGLDDRTEAHEWVQTDFAKDMGVELRGAIAPLHYLETLSLYRFVLSPWGSGIQSARMFEALLVFTVPIVRRIGQISVYDDLISYGFPILVVNAWSNLTAQRLSEYWDAVAPNLPRIRQRCLTADGFWRIFTGANHSCL